MWEYELSILRYMDDRQRKLELNGWGEDGWELISIDNEIAYFKRPIKTKYKVSNINDLPIPGIEGEINRCKALGWKIIAVDGGMVYFEGT